MTIGWFEYGRENGAPAWYGDEIQAPSFVDLQVAGILSLFLVPTLAFLVILPGTRRLRLITTFTFLFSMAVGATITISLYYPAWHTGRVRMFTAYKAFSDDKLHAVLGVKVGLRHVNITFSSKVEDVLVLKQLEVASTSTTATTTTTSGIPANSKNSTFDFHPPKLMATPILRLNHNEKFDFDDVSTMELGKTLEKGLPYPILRVIEYISADRTGFIWGRQYRVAGYYTSSILWLVDIAICLEGSKNGQWGPRRSGNMRSSITRFSRGFRISRIAVPTKFAQATVVLGANCLVANLVYAANVPHDMVILFPGPNNSQSTLKLHFSTCFYAVLLAGLGSFLYGAILWTRQNKSGGHYVFETFISAYLDEVYQRRYETRDSGTDGRSSSEQTGFSTEACVRYCMRKHRWKIVQRRTTRRRRFQFAETTFIEMAQNPSARPTHGTSKVAPVGDVCDELTPSSIAVVWEPFKWGQLFGDPTSSTPSCSSSSPTATNSVDIESGTT